MLRCGQKRRRTTGEIKAEKEEAQRKQKEIEKKLKLFEELKSSNDQLRQEADNHRNSTNILNDLASKQKIRVSQTGEVFVPGVDQIPDDLSQAIN